MKKKYQSGGLTQADRDAGLTQADVDAGLRGGRNERISDEDRARALMNAARDNESIVDRYRDYGKNPEAQAFPIDPKPRATPRAAPRAAPRTARTEPIQEPEMVERVSGRASMPNEIPSGYQPAAPRRAPPSRGSYDRPGPIGSLIELIRGRSGTPSPYRRGVRTEADDIPGAKRGGSVNKMVKKKSSASSASKRGDGIASRGKTKGRML
jgi:hypothetical protein